MSKKPVPAEMLELGDTERPARVQGAVAVTTPTQAPMMPGTFDFGVALQAMLEKASDPNLDKEKFLVLKDTLKEFRAEEAERAFNYDMALAQAEMQPVVRAAEVKLGENKGSYKYATLDGIDEMLRPIMTKYGFSVTYDRTPRQGDGGGFVVTGTLRHRGGHSIPASFPLSLDSGPGRSNAQAAGSTDSYGRKYILLGFFNIVRKNEDDDGVAAGGGPVSFEEAATIKGLVAEAGIGDGLEGEEHRAAVVEWFGTILGYELPKGYASIRQEDGVRVRRALLSLKAMRLVAKAEEVKI